jgi:hypothetical protein
MDAEPGQDHFGTSDRRPVRRPVDGFAPFCPASLHSIHGRLLAGIGIIKREGRRWRVQREKSVAAQLIDEDGYRLCGLVGGGRTCRG